MKKEDFYTKLAIPLKKYLDKKLIYNRKEKEKNFFFNFTILFI